MRHSKYKITKEKYQGDTRYEKIYEQMQLLGIEDVTSHVQYNNGTIVWRLPIKNKWKNGKPIEVASFKTGYVRNQNSGYSNYQLNKRCEGEPEYFKLDNGDYRKFTTKSCVLIPIEIDRLEYLISYCLKNYFIKRANEVADGKLVPEWHYNDGIARWRDSEVNKINYLEEKLDAMTEDRDCKNDRIHDLENKLSNAISPTKYESVKRELAETKVRQDVSVIVNGHRYKVI